MNYGKALREARERKSISQDEAAILAKTSQTYISKIENGSHVPSMKMIERLCASYGVPMPFVVLLAINASDVPKRKRAALRALRPSLDALIDELVPPKQKI